MESHGQSISTELSSNNIERYDRQIRLWGQHGQSKCSSSKICLINADSLGTEILKSLCLAGIHSFTILDSHKLTPEDIGCNFVTLDSLGKNRGESVKRMLSELNDEVIGDNQSIENYLPHTNYSSEHLDHSKLNNVVEQLQNDEEHRKFWKQFNCVIASGFLYIDQINRLSEICWFLNVPLILCKSIGFFGSMRTQLREHLIYERHFENDLPDFRIDRPFKELEDYFQMIDLNKDDEGRINSYPYIKIIYFYLKMWQNEHKYSEDRMPNNYREKQELKKLIEQGFKEVRRKFKKLGKDQAENHPHQQDLIFENFTEAIKATNVCFAISNRKLPENVETIFNHEKANDSLTSNVTNNSSMFWPIIKAIKKFYMEYNQNLLPVSGTIPDMISSSQEYINLQTIYAKRAKIDVDHVFEILSNSIHGPPISSSALYNETKLICKNIRHLELMTTPLIYNEQKLFNSCRFEESDEEDDSITIAICLRAMDNFFSSYGRLPGCQDDQVETDIGKLKECVKQTFGRTVNCLKTLDQCLYEICRYGGSELHATSAFLGGCIGQEVIKIITNQYTPVCDTLIYNAMSATTKTFKLVDVLSKCD